LNFKIVLRPYNTGLDSRIDADI